MFCKLSELYYWFVNKAARFHGFSACTSKDIVSWSSKIRPNVVCRYALFSQARSTRLLIANYLYIAGWYWIPFLTSSGPLWCLQERIIELKLGWAIVERLLCMCSGNQVSRATHAALAWCRQIGRLHVLSTASLQSML